MGLISELMHSRTYGKSLGSRVVTSEEKENKADEQNDERTRVSAN